MNNHINSSDFTDNGIVKIENFLTKKDIEKLKKIVSIYCGPKNISGNSFPINKIDILKNIKNPKKFLDIMKIFNIYNKYKLKKIAKKITSSNIELVMIDGYIAEKSNEHILNWHVDQAYSGKKDVQDFVDPKKSIIKFFFYLTSVQSNNGCLGYIPGSHKITFHLKEMIKNRIIDYSPYWALKNLRDLVKSKEIYSKLRKKIPENFLTSFLERSSFISEPALDTKKFDLPMSEGGLLVFDEAGVHRGSSPSLNDRYVIRFFFRKK